MPKRFTATEKWDKEWFQTLKPKYKCLWIFLCDRCDAAGIWESNFALASFSIGEKITETEIENLGSRVKKIAPNKFFIVGFIEFQYGKLSHDCKPHLPVFKILDKNGIDFETLFKGYAKGIDTLEEKEKDKEQDKEMEMDKEKEKEGGLGGIAEVMIYPTFDDFWNDYDKKRGDKDKIQKKWNQLTQQDKEAVMAYIPPYKQSQPDKQYRKDPETFLNNKSWNDEIIKSGQSNGQNNPLRNLSPAYLASVIERASDKTISAKQPADGNPDI